MTMLVLVVQEIGIPCRLHGFTASSSLIIPRQHKVNEPECSVGGVMDGGVSIGYDDSSSSSGTDDSS
jgi:hypothetical protein